MVKPLKNVIQEYTIFWAEFCPQVVEESMELMLCPGFISFSRRWFDGGVDGLVPIVAMIILQMHRMWHPKSKHHRVFCWHK